MAEREKGISERILAAIRDHLARHHGPRSVTDPMLTNHNAVTIGADGEHSLAGQVLSGVAATAAQAGHATTAQITKLNGIEALADVTDATNVDAANAVMDADIAPAEGFMRKTGAGAYTAHKSNLASAADPAVGDDDVDGYSIGSLWINTTLNKVWMCTDATTGAAVWKQLG